MAEPTNIPHMFKNYFKIALRNFWNNRTFSFLNIAGLAIGITCASLIFLWIEDELTFNHVFENRNNLYEVMENQTYDGMVHTFDNTPSSLAKAIQEEVPGIKHTTRFSWNTDMLFGYGEKNVYVQGKYADSTVFGMLGLKFIEGNAADAFSEVNAVVLSKTAAEKIFPPGHALGNILKVNNEQNFKVTGVYEDLPENATYQFKWLAPYKLFESKNVWLRNWGNNSIQTLVELEPSVDVATVNNKLRNFIATKKTGSETVCFLFPMNDWNLHNKFTNGQQDGGRIAYVRLFSLIAWVVLIIACINFMNLATARSERRAREIGVRKALGATKGSLIVQFLYDSLLMSFIAVILATLLIYLTIPLFNGLVGKKLSVSLFQPLHIVWLLSIAMVTGLVAGSYPAFYLSGFNPISVLKGTRVKDGSAAIFVRKGLVIAQFTTSIVLIISTLIIYQQINHVKQRELGYKKDNLIYLNLKGQLKDHFTTVKDKLKETGMVENAALSLNNVLYLSTSSSGFAWQGKDPQKEILITQESVSPEYLSTMHMKLTSGRDFASDANVDSSNVIINESMAKEMGENGKVGSFISDSDGKRYEIVGVVKDFLYNNMYESGQPLILFCNPESTYIMTIRIAQNVGLNRALSKIEEVVLGNNPGYPFEYKFIDDQFDQLFKTETLIGKLAGVFAVLAILISCLGLFGLVAYTAERRTKELSIRKVLGATTSGLVGLLVKDFVQLVAFSCIIAFPVAWFVMYRWLEDYQYRTKIHWWIFVGTGTLVLGLALITVSFQAIKAAMSDPIKTLKAE